MADARDGSPSDRVPVRGGRRRRRRARGNPDQPDGGRGRGRASAAGVGGEDGVAEAIVAVGTDRAGVVQSIDVGDNTPVHAGQVLVHLDSSSLDDELRRAQAKLEDAETQEIELRVASEDARTKFIRAEQLSERELMAPVDVEAARAALDAADERLRDGQAQVARCEDDVRVKSEERARTVIRAPVDGVVLAHSVAVGQTLSGAPTTLLTIATDEHLRP